MRKHLSKGRFSKRRLKQLVNELIAYAKELCPEAEVIAVKVPGYEELDAMVEIVVPDEKDDEVHDAISRREFEIFMNEGYDIAVRVLSRSDYESLKAKVERLGLK
ncbi:MAG: hypothetical protein BDTLLHRC_000546 [Candidatus Fervidibacter sp.]|jgi:hypothetical protein